MNQGNDGTRLWAPTSIGALVVDIERDSDGTAIIVALVDAQGNRRDVARIELAEPDGERTWPDLGVAIWEDPRSAGPTSCHGILPGVPSDGGCWHKANGDWWVGARPAAHRLRRYQVPDPADGRGMLWVERWHLETGTDVVVGWSAHDGRTWARTESPDGGIEIDDMDGCGLDGIIMRHLGCAPMTDGDAI